MLADEKTLECNTSGNTWNTKSVALNFSLNVAPFESPTTFVDPFWNFSIKESYGICLKADCCIPNFSEYYICSETKNVKSRSIIANQKSKALESRQRGREGKGVVYTTAQIAWSRFNSHPGHVQVRRVKVLQGVQYCSLISIS